MSETCDVNGCEDDARTTCEVTDDNGKVIVEKVVCKEHIKSFLFGETEE